MENAGMLEYVLVSVNAGRKRISDFKGKEAVSGIYKTSVQAAVAIGAEGVSGDEVADLVHHGGPDKAVCIYSWAHYPHWEQVLGKSMDCGAFGENFTLDGMREEDVCIGDVFTVGTATVQVSQPRVPCWKLAMKWGLDQLPDLAAKSGKTGFYLRVLEPGKVQAGDVMARTSRHPAGITVAEANRVMHRDRNDKDGIRALIALEGVLAEAWTGTLAKRLARLENEE